jgi:hypothetical protein
MNGLKRNKEKGKKEKKLVSITGNQRPEIGKKFKKDLLRFKKRDM